MYLIAELTWLPCLALLIVFMLLVRTVYMLLPIPPLVITVVMETCIIVILIFAFI